MADFIDEIEEIEKIQANDFLMEDDDECAAIITSPEVSPGLYEHFKITADKGQSLLRVDKFLVARLVGATRNRIQQAAEAGCIWVNGQAVKSNYRVKPADVVQIVMDRPRRETEIIPQDIPLNIVYEDADLMVVNKPAGMVVHPGHGNYSGTLLNAIAYYLRDDQHFDASDPRLGLVHRIDKDTSGLLVIAKTPEAKSHLGLQFYHHTTKRHYRAAPNDGLSGRKPRKTCRHPLPGIREVRLCDIGGMPPGNRTHASNPRAHEIYRPYFVQRRAIWRT